MRIKFQQKFFVEVGQRFNVTREKYNITATLNRGYIHHINVVKIVDPINWY